MLKSAMPRRYVAAWSGVAVGLKGRRRERKRERAMISVIAVEAVDVGAYQDSEGSATYV